MTLPTGGTINIADIGGTIYRVHTFLVDGDFVIPAGQSYSVEHFLIGGGGGADNAGGSVVFGGGGAGGLIDNIGAATTRTAGTYPVVVGAGGIGNAIEALREGQVTTAFGLTALGGGASVNQTPDNTRNVGCGHGGAAFDSPSIRDPQEGDPAQGFDGGIGFNAPSISTVFSGPGGGQNGDFDLATDGNIVVRTIGNPIEVNFDGQEKEYGTGGAAGSIPFQASLLVQNVPSGVDQPGEDGTGSGAGADTLQNAKNGGSGIAMFRYPTSELPARSFTIAAQEQTNDTASFDIDVENNFTLSAQEQYDGDTAAGEILVTQFTDAVSGVFIGDREVTGTWRRANVN